MFIGLAGKPGEPLLLTLGSGPTMPRNTVNRELSEGRKHIHGRVHTYTFVAARPIGGAKIQPVTLRKLNRKTLDPTYESVP